MNRPERQDLLTLREGARKVIVEKDQKIPDAATIIVELEDHTLGNLMRYQLLREEKVLFAGYKVPHPLDYKVHVKIQTTPDTTPVKAATTALTDLVSELNWFESKFAEQVSKKSNPTDSKYIK